MEPRRWRPRFYNPFTERRWRMATAPPLYLGFFRTMPLHLWSVKDHQRVLGFAAQHPSLFGFPDQPTCIVNTAHFLPSLRSRLHGVTVFGRERGCKSIVVPTSCGRDPFDELDAQLIEPLFRWNPGIEYVYLSRDCQAMAVPLAGCLAQCHKLRTITLEGWNDAVAIHRVMMACKQADVLDTFSLDDAPRRWRNELSVQALTTLIEMHPRLRMVKSHKLFLNDWLEATRYSRCKHVVALTLFGCPFVVLHYFLWMLLLMLPSCAVYALVDRTYRNQLSDNYVQFWAVMSGVSFTTACVVADTFLVRPRYGASWVTVQKYVIIALRRLELARQSARRGRTLIVTGP